MKSEETIFAEAIALPRAQRGSFIEDVCEADDELRRRIEKLVAAHDEQDSFLDADPRETVDAAIKVDAGQDIGPYRLLQKLGEGGFGVVFMAEQRQPVRRQVALKVIKPGMDSKAVVARFEAERQALAMMDHPNIARVFDGGAIAGGERPYFVMELVKGVPITEFCDANALSTTERLELFVSVCNAVHHAHQKGVIHRDIKPTNVMVTLHDGRPVVKVIDFGVAKALHQRLTEKTLFTQYGMMVGTPQYMSPEQAEISGLDVDTRSDVYSLAVLLYELMTGTTPLQAESLREAGYRELQRLIREEEPVKPSKRLSSSGQKLTVLAKHRSISPDRLPRQVQGDLDWIVMKGLEKDRRRRYDSASDLATDIRRALANEPVHAGPPSSVYRAKKFLVRHRRGVTSAAVLTILIAALASAFWFTHRQTLAARRQDETRLASAVDQANNTLTALTAASPADDRWTSAAYLASQVQLLATESNLDQASLGEADAFLRHYQSVEQDRQFAMAMENLLIARGTQRDLPSWMTMEEELRRILRERGYDVGRETAAQVGLRMRDDPSHIQLADALELWIAARQHAADLGGPELTESQRQSWTDAMSIADPDPLRVAIRNVIYSPGPPDESELEEVVRQSNLAKKCPRKLSWLAESYRSLGNVKRSEEVQRYALMQHPADLMLNFEYATTLMNEKRYDHAIRYYMRCTSLRPNVPGIWRNLADAFIANGETDAAEDARKIAKDLEQTSPDSNNTSLAKS
ncbi:serine/threonine-protein kinase [Rhodopirellula sallentina]|uniref:Serine/threonine protein kinase n=1 Tax=Rhodopirellula sallentina SM41 TaxID=1263870 RepID=M5UG27_9BACT|nr:serine/threonine-protein kinase [Rhodopirellula sallentina]EMI56791.1 serine/threonine protein kinase [Rhodopirellula sallentina SM41]